MRKALYILILIASQACIFPSSVTVVSQDARWTVEDVLKQESISSVNIAPDGNRILWQKRYPDKEKNAYVSDVFLTYRVDPNGSSEAATVRLTRTGDVASPQFSPDGKLIAFISSRTSPDGKVKGSQIWIMDPLGGEPYPLTKLENGVSGFKWSGNTEVLFSAREEDTYYEGELKKAKDDVRVVEDSTLFYPVRLFRISTEKKEPERVSDNLYRITEFEPDPSGTWVVYSEDDSPIDTDARHQPHQYLLNLKTGQVTEIFAAKYFDPGGFVWKLDGSGFYASDEFASDPEWEGSGINLLYFFDMSTKTHRQVNLDWDNGVGSGGYAVTSNGLHVQLADGARMVSRYYRQNGNSWTHSPVSDDRFRNTTSITIGPDGKTVLFVYSRADVPPQYLAGTYSDGSTSDVKEVVKINEYLNKKRHPKAEVIEWVGAEGDTVNGILYYPLDYEPGKKYPLVIGIHGGPSGVDLDAWRLSSTIYPGIWAERGAFMLRPNYHGSGHHSLEFVESIKGRYYELEVPDIINGIQYLADKGMVDMDQLGLIGWSNGAILTTALTIEYPEMFKVAAPGAGDVNWISDYGNCAFGVRFDNSYFKGPPWEFLDHYIEKSPLFRLDRVLTPTLIHHGTEDTNVPTEQGWQYYRALQQIGKAPVRFILYPGQPHGLRPISYQRRKMEEDITWFDTYLFGKTDFESELAERVLPKTAPLSMLNRIREIAREGTMFGVVMNGILAPEVVSVNDSLSVGRFEVTRKQFQAFKSSYRVDPGKEDYPANSISFEEARAYVAWLSEKTGKAYRLPDEKEWNVVSKLSGGSENTLEYWLGYKPNTDELRQLASTLAGIPADDLLMRAGSRPAGNGSSETSPLVFDVGGNVAEWVAGENGAGVVKGVSAGSVKDDRTPGNSPTADHFVGFRVVLSN